jgi:hypothetical protein
MLRNSCRKKVQNLVLMCKPITRHLKTLTISSLILFFFQLSIEQVSNLILELLNRRPKDSADVIEELSFKFKNELKKKQEQTQSEENKLAHVQKYLFLVSCLFFDKNFY